MFEIFQHVGTVGDLLAINAVGFLRHLFDGFFPARRMLRLLFASQRQRFETCCDHQFQIPFGENRVGVFPVENLALLGDANLAGETSGRLGEDGRVRGTTAAAHGSTATVEEAKLYSTFLRRLMQFAMSFIEFPRAGEHASVFVGVGVAQHDFLPPSPGVEQRLIVGIAPEASHDSSGGAKRIDRFEQRHGHQPGIVGGSCDLNASDFGELHDVPTRRFPIRRR